MFRQLQKLSKFSSSSLLLQAILLGHNKSKTVEIPIKRLQDPKGSEQEVKKTKLTTVFYLQQLGISQHDISTMIDMKRTTVQSAIGRIAETGTTLAGKSTGRPSTFDKYTKRHLERIIRKDPFQTIEMIRDKLRLMGKTVCRSTVKEWIKQLGFKYSSPASKPKLSDTQKKKIRMGQKTRQLDQRTMERDNLV
ncbi:hypothetical protein K7432_014982 [Basidiobolus ranarum]|uniref:Transposase Tc1-like domain-containing protein n=1 Tax=Basidiobolus ranarum TaxID=34480 RepID=A0ABR2WGS6_9FUNG